MITRRQFVETSAMALAGFTVGLPLSGCKENKPDSPEKPFRISLNTSTINPYKLPVDQQIELCGVAGFDGIELWISDIMKYLDKGGSLADLARKLKDNRLVLENIIGFAQWSSEDEQIRKAGQLQMQREMELTAQLGGKFIAAPMMGVKRVDRERLEDFSRYYLHILEIGKSTGVTPLLELWGAGALYNLADAVHVALGTGHPDANFLLDFYHLYRGGNSFDSLRVLNVARLPLFHINDYPDFPVRDQLTDKDRVYPGDGICPFGTILPVLFESGFCGAFSVELFNESYCKQPVEEMLSFTLNKTKQLITHN